MLLPLASLGSFMAGVVVGLVLRQVATTLWGVAIGWWAAEW